LNQSNSQRFKGPASFFRWNSGNLAPTIPARQFRQRFPVQTYFPNYPPVHRKQLQHQRFEQPCATF
jgi:hypothetical protein